MKGSRKRKMGHAHRKKLGSEVRQYREGSDGSDGSEESDGSEGSEEDSMSETNPIRKI